MPTSVPISVVIITFNEERNIARCIDSVEGIADEVVVVDSFSTDKTKEICLQRGVKFIENKFIGHIEQKNFALTKASYNYVLSLDADEALSLTLKNAIQRVKNNWEADAYEMNRLTNYCGKWIKHSDWYPDTKIRLLNKTKAYWGGLNPHDEIILNTGATLQHLPGDILHFSFRTITQHIRQLDYFTEIGASIAFNHRKKATLVHILFSPFMKFFKSYIIKKGFMDGYYGFLVCAISAFASFLKYVKMKELYKKEISR